MRIARSDADGVAIFTLPLSISPKKTADVLRSQLNGPLLLLNAAELADRGLLPGGTRYRSGRPQGRDDPHPA